MIIRALSHWIFFIKDIINGTLLANEQATHHERVWEDIEIQPKVTWFLYYVVADYLDR